MEVCLVVSACTHKREGEANADRMSSLLKVKVLGWGFSISFPLLPRGQWIGALV